MESKNSKLLLVTAINLPVIQYQTNYKQKLLLQNLCDVINNSSVLLNQVNNYNITFWLQNYRINLNMSVQKHYHPCSGSISLF